MNARPLPNARQPEKTVSLVAAWGVVRRHRFLFALVFVPAILAGIAYTLLASPQYTATSVVLIDTRSRNPGQQTAAASAAVESANVDSQVEVLRSEGVFRSVVEALDLTKDPEFMRRSSLTTEWVRPYLKTWFGLDLDEVRTDPTIFAIGVLEKNIVVKRLGMSYVIQLDYKSTSAKRAAEIANKIVECYIANQVDARQVAEKSFNEWLERRTAVLRGEAVRTERMLSDWKLSEATDRAARAYEKSGEAATGREPPLQQSLGQAAAEMAQAARENAELKEFESAAQTSRALAETFARRLAEFVPQGAATLSEARVISNALPPREKSEPKTILVIGSAIVLGALGGFGAAALREKSLRGLRSVAQLEIETGLHCLGTLARVPGRSNRRGSGGAPSPAEAALLRRVLERPMSGFAETVRTVRAGIRTPTAARPAQTIGVVSTLAGEGRGVVSANLGHLCAASGTRTLLIDLDLREASLSRRLVPDAREGVAEVVAGNRTVGEVVHHDPESGLHILPAIALPPTDAFGILSSAAMAQFITIIAQQFDLVILHLPAILANADARALAPAVDAYILVVAWGATEPADLLQGMRTMPDIRERLLGVVLNGAPAEAKREKAVARGARPRRTAELA